MTLNKEWKDLLELAEKALSHNQDWEWPIGEMLLVPPFYDHRKYSAAASPDVIKRLIGELVELQEVLGKLAKLVEPPFWAKLPYPQRDELLARAKALLEKGRS